MRQIFVNLKRFDIPRSVGGLCPSSDPLGWIEGILDESARMGLGSLEGVHLTYLLPEGLIPTAARRLIQLPEGETPHLHIGCQGVHWEDVKSGANFGAFTSSLPASAARNLGCSWAMIGHSEERKAKQQVLSAYDSSLTDDSQARAAAAEAINRLVQAEVTCALEADLDVLLCIGETAEERGGGRFDEQKPRIQGTLRAQLLASLDGVSGFIPRHQIVIGYEPIWAIGPGKSPPGKDYIAFVSAYIKQTVKQAFEFRPIVVYGGGLKEENAPMIAEIDTIGGGLVALTRFSGQIGFDVQDLKAIIAAYQA